MNSMGAFPYATPVSPESVGFDENRLSKVFAQFKRQQDSGVFPGGQLVVRRNGKLVVNEAVGSAPGFCPQESLSPV